MAEWDTVTIVGVGLVGSSIGLALRERKLAGEVIGVGRNRQRLALAEELGAIDRGTTDVASAAADAALTVVCTPVDQVAAMVGHVASAGRAGSLVTDAGSTKQAIVASVDAALATLREAPSFVGSHPLAGDHRTGPAHGRAALFVGRTVVVTPTAATSPEATRRISAFWESLGAVVTRMTPAEHDAALAATSHLPHLVASALAAATPEAVLPLAAGGWGDTTRVAGGDPRLWRPIFTTNREQVLSSLARFGRTLDQVRAALESGDDAALLAWLHEAQRIKAEHDALGD